MTDLAPFVASVLEDEAVIYMQKEIALIKTVIQKQTLLQVIGQDGTVYFERSLIDCHRRECTDHLTVHSLTTNNNNNERRADKAGIKIPLDSLPGLKILLGGNIVHRLPLLDGTESCSTYSDFGQWYDMLTNDTYRERPRSKHESIQIHTTFNCNWKCDRSINLVFNKENQEESTRPVPFISAVIKHASRKDYLWFKSSYDAFWYREDYITSAQLLHKFKKRKENKSIFGYMKKQQYLCINELSLQKSVMGGSLSLLQSTGTQ